MNTILWIIQGSLFAFFFVTGFEKISSNKQQHIANGHMKTGNHVLLIWVLGVFEIAGSVGIIFPWFTGIGRLLTPITAVCFCLVMAGALIIHTQKKEYRYLPIPVIVLILATTVAYFRFLSDTTY